jgi:hypothetical protein
MVGSKAYVALQVDDLPFAADRRLYIWTSSNQNGLYRVNDPSSDTTRSSSTSDSTPSSFTTKTGPPSPEGGVPLLYGRPRRHFDGLTPLMRF